MKDIEAKRNAPAGKRKKDPRRRAEERVNKRTSDLSRAAERIAESESLFRLCIENMLDGFAILSPVRGRGGEIEDFRYVHMNEAGCQITEISREEHLESTQLSLYPEAGPGGLLEAFVRVAETGESLSMDSWPYKGIFGGREVSKFFDVRAFRSGGNVAVVFRDITARKEAEKTLSRLASFPEVNPNPVVEVDMGGAVHYLNAAARSLFPDLEKTGFLHPWLVGMAPVLDRIRRGGEGSTATMGVSAGDRHYHQSIHYLEGQGRFRIYSIDITERKRAEEELRESEARLRWSQEVGQIGWWKLDTRQNVLIWSKENHRIFAVPEETPLTYETFLGIVHPDDRPYVDTRWQAALRGEPYDIEHRLLVDGQVKWVREKAYLEFEDGRLLGAFGITQDITARKHAKEALQASLSEKEILLRELAHRTKNNMQVIVALLDLQAAASKDGKIKVAISDIQDRIRTMALVHENLYKTGDFSSLSMRTYVQDLMDTLLRAHRKAEQSIATCLDLDEISVSIDTALPCGLIVTELVSNSLKHAFAERESGSIFLSFRKKGEHTEMRYRDDGPGLPPDMDLSRVNTLGLKLIRNLSVHQLRGTMDVRQGPGTEFVFVFHDLDPGRRR